MESALYECSVMHHRMRPKEHAFRYRVFYLWLDLDELPSLSESLKLFSYNRRGIFSFHDSDHLADPGTLKRSLLEVMDSGGVNISLVHSIRLLTFPRILGYIFNPVCFYYAYGSDGGPLCAVAEVTNTFHEKKRYLLTDETQPGRFRLTAPKYFYVSPFSALDLVFDFKLAAPDKRVAIHIDDRDASGPVIVTALTGTRRDLTDGALLSCLFKYPLLTLRVIFLIHWHALLLWLKRVPWHRKSDRSDLQLDVHPPASKS